MSFAPKCVLLIGATSGIGAGMAEKLVRSGSKVIAVGRRQDRIDEFIRKHSSDKAGGFAYDITHGKGLNEFVKGVTTSYPDLDCVYLNAGVQGAYDFAKPGQVDLERFHDEMNINYTCLVNITTAFLPFLQAKASPASVVLLVQRDTAIYLSPPSPPLHTLWVTDISCHTALVLTSPSFLPRLYPPIQLPRLH